MAHYGATGFVITRYLRSVYEHKNRLNVLIDGTPIIGDASTELIGRGAVNINWRTAMTAYLNEYRKTLNNASDITSCELWYKPTETSNPIWIDQFAPGLSGASATAAVVASQAVFAFGTSLGGKAFIYQMEQISAVNQQLSFPLPAGVIKDIADFCTGVNGFMVGYDGAYFSHAIRWQTKTNDVLRKKILGLGGG